MHTGKLLFAQLMHFLPRRDFDSCVRRYKGNQRTRKFSCLDQFLCMAFAQLTYRTSLRDIEICLNSLKPKLYHAGIRGSVARTTLAGANESAAGTSTPTSPKSSFAMPANCMPTTL